MFQWQCSNIHKQKCENTVIRVKIQHACAAESGIGVELVFGMLLNSAKNASLFGMHIICIELL